MPKGYPKVMSELETVNAALEGRSIARYGDGELRICLGGNSISQKVSPKLRAELITILGKESAALACIPNAKAPTPLYEKCWQKYVTPKYTAMYAKKEFGSSFITRPDSAPWINHIEYWERIEALWDKRDVVLVVGQETSSLVPAHMEGANSVRVVTGPQRDAYDVIDSIEAMIGTPTGPVLLCLGACATVLAERLAKRKLWGIDMGHMGRFLPPRGELWHQKTREEKGKAPLP